jgi:GNAT superfamily N-acetyltransferase
VVARDKHGFLCGGVVGTTEPTGFFGRLLRKRWRGFLVASARVLFRNPKAAQRLVRTATYRGNAPVELGGALLSSIFVEPAFSGSGIGSLLIDEWTRVAASKGAGWAFLDTDAIGNEIANDFYKARGWHLASTFDTREGRKMNRYTTGLETR